MQVTTMNMKLWSNHFLWAPHVFLNQCSYLKCLCLCLKSNVWLVVSFRIFTICSCPSLIPKQLRKHQRIIKKQDCLPEMILIHWVINVLSSLNSGHTVHYVKAKCYPVSLGLIEKEIIILILSNIKFSISQDCNFVHLTSWQQFDLVKDFYSQKCKM